MLWRWLELILAYLVERFGEKVMNWTLRQVVEYFRDHPEQGQDCQREMARDWRKGLDPDDPDAPYFWER